MKCSVCSYEFFIKDLPETILGKKLIRLIQWKCPVCSKENREYFPV